ncbi:MAG: permease prefix domain 1-containing protein [Pseudolysinimonas sp.]|uniref:permease prefix domain 1-containing protein n=1 Tax=Pseudolysinimonas sp. TaxID=2680009 RepID=UPI003C70701A
MSTTRRPVGRPTADTLTDRYVWAVLKSLPESKRTDIDRELRASIADDVDARVAAGATPDAAEKAVLTELGEPMRLAAGYAGRPLALIGPDLYVDYVRLLKLLAVTVIPIVAITLFVINALTGAAPGELIGGTVGIVISVGVHLGFWVTLVFALVERMGVAKKSGLKDNSPFDPDDLPAVATGTTGGRSELIASLVVALLVPVALVWQQISSNFEEADGSPIPVINPALWSFWLPYLIALAVLTGTFAVVLYRVGRWTWPLVAVNAVLTIATIGPMVWLVATGAALNEAYLDRLGWAEFVAAGSPGATIASIALVAIGGWATADSVIKTVQADRSVTRG